MEANNETVTGKVLEPELIDIEDELVKFTVRSSKSRCEERPSSSRDYKNEIDLIPLLVMDIHQLKLPDRSFSETITAYGLPFSSVLIYGRISSTGACANGKMRYCLDDGTGLIQVRLVKHSALKDVDKLDLQCLRTFGNNKELYNSVQNILKVTRKQLLDFSTLPYGTRALLIGRPHRCFEDVVFSAFEMIVDNDNTGDLEMSVKNCIINWYTKRYKAHPS